MRRHNQKLYRVVRAILKDEHDVEDVMQQAYVNAFVHLHQFEERSRFSTWLTRIALNEAFGRRRKMRLVDPIPVGRGWRSYVARDQFGAAGPRAPGICAGACAISWNSAIDALPEGYRLVFMLRVVEGLSTSETGEGLGLGVEAIKTRLHRARVMLQPLGDRATGRCRSGCVPHSTRRGATAS